MELFIFARFHAIAGCESEVREMLHAQRLRVADEPGCLSIHAFRSTRNPRLFYLHSRWVDEAAFDVHTAHANTTRFVEWIEKLIDHPLDVTRTTLLD